MTIRYYFFYFYCFIFENFKKGSESKEKSIAIKSREINAQDSKSIEAKPMLNLISLSDFKNSEIWQEEVFGPYALLILCSDIEEFKEVAHIISGQLTATIWSEENELHAQEEFVFEIQQKVGRIIFNGVPTGVEVIDSMHHGGAFPATTDARYTAVGKDAIYRFLKSISFQGFPESFFGKKS